MQTAANLPLRIETILTARALKQSASPIPPENPGKCLARNYCKTKTENIILQMYNYTGQTHSQRIRNEMELEQNKNEAQSVHTLKPVGPGCEK